MTDRARPPRAASDDLPVAAAKAARPPTTNLPPPPKWWGPAPKLEGPIAGVVRLAWNLAISLTIAGMIAILGGWIVGEALERFFGPLSAFGVLLQRVAWWIAFAIIAFIVAVSYYLDDGAD